MTQHAYLEHGLTVLEARLKTPQQPGQIGRVIEACPFITLGHETGAGATTVGQLLVPLLDQSLGEKDQGWVFLDKNLLTHALAHPTCRSASPSICLRIRSPKSRR